MESVKLPQQLDLTYQLTLKKNENFPPTVEKQIMPLPFFSSFTIHNEIECNQQAVCASPNPTRAL